MTTPHRRSRDETRELVVSAALDLVEHEGLGVEPTTITYQKVFQHLERTKGVRITRASVHERLWASQEEFQVEVLLRMSRMATGLDLAGQLAAASLAETGDLTSEARMRELSRVAPDALLQVAAADPRFSSWVGVTLSVANDSEPGDPVRDRLAARTTAEYAESESRAAELIRRLALATGVRPRANLFTDPDLGFRLIARLGLTLAEGATVRLRFDKGELPNVHLKTGIDGELQEWTAFAAGFWALLNTYLEEDPDADASEAEGG